MVKNSVATLLAMPLAASLLLAGCGGDPPPPVAASASSTRSARTPQTSTTTGPTTSPTTSAPAVDPGIPAAARAHTPAGAEAFVRHYLNQINQVMQKPAPGELIKLAVATCKSCQNYEHTAAAMATDRQRYSGPSYKILEVTSGAATGPTTARVYARAEQLPIRVLSADGAVIEQVKQLSGTLSYDLIWTVGVWRVSESYVQIDQHK